MVFRLLEAEPDAFVSRNALDEGERGFVVLGDVFVTLVLRPQVEPEVDALAIPIVAQRVRDDFLRRLLLEQPAGHRAGKISDTWLDKQPVARLIRGRIQLVELRHDAVNGSRRRHLTELRRVLAKHPEQIGGVRIDGVDHELRGPPQHLVHRNISDNTRELDVIAVESADAFIAFELQHRERRRMRRKFDLVRLGRQNHEPHQRLPRTRVTSNTTKPGRPSPQAGPLNQPQQVSSSPWASATPATNRCPFPPPGSAG
ncbi:hypothetical protein R70211_06505 [Paraburkholderia domus]|uniref:Uncharacterized protein n=1 Tax=Paraburkholderia domus TaxID=2793075 RepID=A0A9N8R4C9_9BURK|nr:hypothetical protein R70211_06505 [Paraburkholderia domus]